jgi:hypothetical protein
MFLLRSIFWLTIGFILVAPRDADLGADLGQAARTLSSEAVAAGQQMIVDEILKAECSTLQCAGGKAVLTSLVAPSSPSVVAPASDATNLLVPIPRPRPDRMG